MSRRIAILIDGGFFLKRLPSLMRAERCTTPEHKVACIRRMCRRHVQMLIGQPGSQAAEQDRNWIDSVYRIFYYDALSYDGKAHHPIDNRPIDFGKSDVARDRLALFDLLRKQRKVALRLGKVNREHDWALAPRLTKILLRHREALEVLDRLALPSPPREGSGATQTAAVAPQDLTLTLTPDEQRRLLALREVWRGLDTHAVTLGLRQKGVDMRIGIDIAALALKKQADTIVLVSGDSDFVPAAKLARREGIDFVLDPLWQQVNDDLYEHIDGLQSGLPRPELPRSQPTGPLDAGGRLPQASIVSGGGTPLPPILSLPEDPPLDSDRF